MPDDPPIQATSDAQTESNSSARWWAVPIETLRRNFKDAMVQQSASVPLILVAATTDRTIPGPEGEIPVRVYTPEGSAPFPLIVFFHASGFIAGDLDTHDLMCRALCKGVTAVVISVDYRLAPEHKFPAGPHDCFAATRWVADHAAELGGDPARIALVGQSAGATMAAVTAFQARDAGGPPLRGQLLLYPVTDLHEPYTQFALKNAKGDYDFEQEDIEFKEYYRNLYLERAKDADDPLASPYCAEDLKGLPPALVITAEYDLLRDEGEAFAKRLSDAGIPTVTSRYEGMNHGFLDTPIHPGKPEQAMQESYAWLKGVLQG